MLIFHFTPNVVIVLEISLKYKLFGSRYTQEIDNVFPSPMTCSCTRSNRQLMASGGQLVQCSPSLLLIDLSIDLHTVSQCQWHALITTLARRRKYMYIIKQRKVFRMMRRWICCAFYDFTETKGARFNG